MDKVTRILMLYSKLIQGEIGTIFILIPQRTSAILMPIAVKVLIMLAKSTKYGLCLGQAFHNVLKGKGLLLGRIVIK